MTEDQFFNLIGKLFIVEQNKRLEKKAWFRFIKVAQGLAIFVVILFAILVGYLLFDDKSVSTATLICNDGTTWNAIDQNDSYGSYKSELDMYEKCGLCNYRLPGNQYNKCGIGSQTNLLFDSYEVERTYTRNHSFLGIAGWTALALFGGLLVVKIAAKAIIYILGGGNKEN